MHSTIIIIKLFAPKTLGRN